MMRRYYYTALKSEFVLKYIMINFLRGFESLDLSLLITRLDYKCIYCTVVDLQCVSCRICIGLFCTFDSVLLGGPGGRSLFRTRLYVCEAQITIKLLRLSNEDVIIG